MACFIALIVAFIVAISLINGMYSTHAEDCCSMPSDLKQNEICLVCTTTQRNNEGGVSNAVQEYSPYLNFPEISAISLSDCVITTDNLINLKVRLNN